MATLKTTSTGAAKSIGTQRVSKTSAKHDIKAGQINVTADGVSATNVKDAIEEISAKTVTVQASAPINEVNEGNLWYDTDDDVMYIRDEDSWNEIHVDGSSTLDGGTFT
tara:strand:+ start:1548 stop:1874 length:327 start_codon:yes stop_codon:yes gene_type:complete